MTCTNPRIAYYTGRLTANGKQVLSFSPAWPNQPSFLVPCGHCMACRLRKRNDWISRLRVEAMQWPFSSFLTLTYDDAHVPPHLVKRDLQLFFKRLRHTLRDFGFFAPVRYFACGEYGKLHWRPHYHAILFGLNLLAPEWKSTQVAFSGCYPIYQSDVIRFYWPFGFNTVDLSTDASIKYVSKYVCKVPDELPDFLGDFTPFAIFSQGIGRSAFVDVVRHGRKVDKSLKPCFRQHYTQGNIVVPSRRGYDSLRIPSCLDRYAEQLDPSLFESVKQSRREFALHTPQSLTPSARSEIANFKCAAIKKERILDNES